jgi:hypothetical protein
MLKQPAFPGLRDAMKKKQMRRELFLGEMDAVLPWVRLMALITSYYLKAGPEGGRPPKLLKAMLRVYFLQNWYALTKASHPKHNLKVAHFSMENPAHFCVKFTLSVQSQAKLSAIARQLSERPRKTFQYQTPAEKFAECVASLS